MSLCLISIWLYFSFFLTVAPQLIKIPDRFILIDEGTSATVTCEAFSHPPSVVTWARAFTALPKGRTSNKNGTLSIENFAEEDSGAYVCTARNKLGSITAVTTLGFQKKRGNINASNYCRFSVIVRYSCSSTLIFSQALQISWPIYSLIETCLTSQFIAASGSCGEQSSKNNK